METKTCPICNTEKPICEFYEQEDNHYRIFSICKACSVKSREIYNEILKERNIANKR